MSGDLIPDDEHPPNTPPAEGQILSPPEGPTFTADAIPSPSSAVVVREFEYSEFHAGPLPHPLHIERMAKSYSEAPAIIFTNFQEQGRHRRVLEAKVVDSRVLLASRGQWIGAAIGMTGVVGSLIAICLGHDWAGVSFGSMVLLGLVGVFVTGRYQDMQERLEKEKVRERIKRGDSVEKLEGLHPPGDSSDKSSAS
ncbi:MAG: hypothetical protein ACLP56_05380 [Candidatus Sulfotelmatobacter sp.]